MKTVKLLLDENLSPTIALQLRKEGVDVPSGFGALRGNRAGQHSIRINDQWRICFIWGEGGPSNVEIVDYHS